MGCERFPVFSCLVLRFRISLHPPRQTKNQDEQDSEDCEYVICEFSDDGLYVDQRDGLA